VPPPTDFGSVVGRLEVIVGCRRIDLDFSSNSYVPPCESKLSYGLGRQEFLKICCLTNADPLRAGRHLTK
jgi:hypothetical protein